MFQRPYEPKKSSENKNGLNADVDACFSSNEVFI